MQITKERSDMIMDLNPVIEDTWGIYIGFDTPDGGFVGPEDSFVVCWEGREDTTYHLVSILDYERGPEDSFLMGPGKSEHLIHDEKVESFLNKLDAALLDGEICFCPGVTEKVGNKEYTVTKEPKNRFSIHIDHSYMKEMLTISRENILTCKHHFVKNEDMKIIKRIVEQHFV
jgi:hypothetical protein